MRQTMLKKMLLNSKITLSLLIFVGPCYSNSAEMKKSPLHIIEFKKLPVIGKHNAKDILLGGFSSLEFISENKNILKFRTITDRGPNGEAIEFDSKLGHNLRPFLLPDFSPLIVEFELNPKNEIQNLLTQNIFTQTGEKISGLPAFEQNPKNVKNIEQAIFNNKKLAPNINGLDPEGICTDHLGRTWVSDEYHPSISIFDKNKKMIQRLSAGTDFPTEYSERKINRGFEGLTCDQNYVYAMLQSPLPLKNSVNKKIIRILRIDIKTLKAKDQFAYALEDKDVDKIGDIANDNAGHFYVFEQNGKLGKDSKQFLFSTELIDANALPLTVNPELWTEKDIEKKAVTKHWVRNFTDDNLTDIEKIEGLAVVKNKIFMLIDNDFGIITKKNGDITFDHNLTPKLIWFEFEPKGKK